MTKKALMPRLLNSSGVGLVVLLATGCAYHNPTQPTPPAVSDAAPAFIALSVPGNGTVSAYVQNAHGAPLSGVTVLFATNVGSLSPTVAQTTADGRASSTLTAPIDARVTATTGTLSAQAVVAAPTTPVPPPTPTPTPGPAPTPAPPAPSVLLNVASTATTGVSLVFGVSGPAVAAPWQWNFGDGATFQTYAFVTSHTYTAAGSYTATVSGVGTASASATITVSDPPKPTPTAPAPAATLAASMACTAGTHGVIGVATATVCNVSATYGGNPVPSSQITSTVFDWGDGQTSGGGPSPTGSHTYAVAGTYTVFATVAATPTGATAQTATTSKIVTIP